MRRFLFDVHCHAAVSKIDEDQLPSTPRPSSKHGRSKGYSDRGWLNEYREELIKRNEGPIIRRRDQV